MPMRRIEIREAPKTDGHEYDTLIGVATFLAGILAICLIVYCR